MNQEKFKHQLPYTILLIAILIFGAWYLFAENISTYPAYIHAWTQSDRLALAMNFQENGFDFFHPATYSLLTKDGITQVDFPIHDYLVACISSFLKIHLVSVFRVYNLVYSLIGLFFFFRLTVILTKSPLRSIFATSFLFTIPFFVYYQNGFLPSTPSFANFLIALFFLTKAKNEQSNKAFIIAVLFLTVAALARSPFFIFLFALLLQQLWQQWKQKKWSPIQLFTPLLGIVLFIVYFLYNQYLANTYGSMFLSELLYFRSFSQFSEIVEIAIDRWGKQLLSPFHAVLFLIILVIGSVQYQKKGLPNKLIKPLLQYFLLSSVGVLLFFFAFGLQFADHDYYYIDTFLPLLSILFVLLLSRIEIKRNWYTPIASLCIIFFFYFFSYAKSTQQLRYTPTYNDRIVYGYSAYNASINDLKDWGVTPEDTLYVLEAHSTNMPFTLFKTKGFTSLNSSKENVSRELDSIFTYAVLVDSFFISSAFKSYPGIILKLKRINGNGKLSLYRKSESNNPTEFFENLIYYGYSDFDAHDNIPDSASAWTPEEIIIDSMGKSLKIQDVNLYTLSIKSKLENVIENKPIKVHVLGDYLQQKDSTKLRVVASVNNYYHAHYAENHFNDTTNWNNYQFDFKIGPKYFKNGDELNVYLWNPEKETLFVDNFKILIYQ